MENTPLLTPVETPRSAVFRVTPLSKYLAMLLFITMPFIGGWIGYTYAPEKVVEVEKVVFSPTVERVNEQDTDSQRKFLGSTHEGGYFSVYSSNGQLVFEPSNWTEKDQVPPTIDGAMIENFMLVPPDYYATYGSDMRSVFCMRDGEIISDKPETFKVITRGVIPSTDNYAWIYATDGETVFFGCDPIAGADPKTFTSVRYYDPQYTYNTLYATDAKSVYFKGVKVNGADALSFKLNPAVEDMYEREARAECGDEPCPYVSQYFEYLSLGRKSATNTTYTPSISHDAYDKNHTYMLGVRVE